MRDLDLTSLMRKLYEDMSYFVQIPPDGSATYEEEYHKETVDPDGNSRQLLNERDHALAGIKEIVDFLNNEVSPGRILDVGCGLGWLLSSLDDGWEKHGIEISRFASKHASQFGQVYNGILEDYTGVKDFDVVVMNHVIEHLPDPINSLRIVYDLLKPGGSFVIGTPDFDSGAARRYGSNFRLLHDPTHISLFSCDSMHRCLRDLGFKIKHVEYPFFETPWFSETNILKIMDTKNISPPFSGSTMTFFCERP